MTNGSRSGPASRLDGQVAWVTGAGGGIGRAVALQLAGRGARVLLSGRGERALGEAVGEVVFQGGVGRFCVADVREASACEAAARRAIELWGRLDVVVACAGVGGGDRLVEGGEGDAARAAEIVATNLLGVVYTTRAAARVMAGPGRIVAIGSVLGGQGAAGRGAYCASKAGVEGFVRAAALELAPRGITVNAVCPGWVDTAMAQRSMTDIARERGASPAEIERAIVGGTPMGRTIDPDEVARVVVFVAGPDAAMMTGQALVVCGGATAGAV